MKETIKDAISEVIQTQSRTPKIEWWYEECRQHIKKKKKQDLNGSNKIQEQTTKHIRR